MATLLAALLLCCPLSGATQTPATEVSDQDSVTVTTLSLQIEQRRSVVFGLRDRAAALATARHDLAESQPALEAAWTDAEQTLADVPQADELRHLRTQWQARRDTLQTSLDERTQLLLALEDEKKLLLDLLQQWNDAFDRAAEKTVKKISKKNRSNSAEMASADLRIFGKSQLDESFSVIDGHLGVLAEAVRADREILTRMDEMLKLITDMEPTLDGKLFRQSHPPLWSLPEGYFSARLEKGSLTLQEKWQNTLGYLLQQRTSVIVLFFFYAATLYLMLRLRANEKLQLALAESAHLRFGLLGRPYSTAIAVTCLCGFLIKDLPPLLFALLALLAMVPVLRLGAPAFDSRFRPLLWLVSLLFLMGEFAFVIRDLPGINRLWYLAQSLFITAVCAIWLPRLKRTEFHRFWQKWLVSAVLQSTLLLAIFTLVANIIGWFAAASLLLPALIVSLYWGVAALIMASIATDLIFVVTQLPFFSRFNSLHEHRYLILLRVRRFGIAVAALVWLVLSLHQFLVYDWAYTQLVGVLGAEWGIGKMRVSLGDVLAVFVTLWLSVQLSRFLRFFFNEEIVPRSQMPRGMPATISTLLHYAVVLLGFTLAMSAAGIDLSRLAILAGALGVGIGIGLQDVVNNFSAGLILLVERHIKTGDLVQTDTIHGVVTQIGLRASIVRTGDGAEVVVPNGKLVSTQVVNWTRSDSQRRITIAVRAAYNSKPQQVIDTLLAVGKTAPGLLDTPAPVAYILRFGENSLDFELRVWVDNTDNMTDITSGLYVGIIDAFQSAGIEIPFPQRDVHVVWDEACAAGLAQAARAT